MIRRPPRSTLFPYTRSSDLGTRSGRAAFLRRTKRRTHQSLSILGQGPHCACRGAGVRSADHEGTGRSEEHTSELQSQSNLVCRLLLEKKKKHKILTAYHHTT